MKPYYQDGSVTIYHGDCREMLPEIPYASCVVADPPYTFGLNSSLSTGKAGGWGDLMNNAMFYAWMLKEAKRLVASGAGAAWVFNSWRSFPVLARAACDASWPMLSVLVWDKAWIGADGVRGLRPSYEVVGLFADEKYAMADRSVPDIWTVPWSAHKPTGHSAEKPVRLISRMIELSGGTGLIVDPFCGSGTTLRAAKDLGRKAIGIEIEERYCEIAAKRCAQEVLF